MRAIATQSTSQAWPRTLGVRGFDYLADKTGVPQIKDAGNQGVYDLAPIATEDAYRVGQFTFATICSVRAGRHREPDASLSSIAGAAGALQGQRKDGVQGGLKGLGVAVHLRE